MSMSNNNDENEDSDKWLTVSKRKKSDKSSKKASSQLNTSSSEITDDIDDTQIISGPPSQIPCRFFQLGQCTKGSKCPFMHKKTAPHFAPQLCKFYQSGFCKNADKCPFSHDLGKATSTTTSSPTTSTKSSTTSKEKSVKTNDDNNVNKKSSTSNISTTKSSTTVTNSKVQQTTTSAQSAFTTKKKETSTPNGIHTTESSQQQLTTKQDVVSTTSSKKENAVISSSKSKTLPAQSTIPSITQSTSNKQKAATIIPTTSSKTISDSSSLVKKDKQKSEKVVEENVNNTTPPPTSQTTPIPNHVNILHTSSSDSQVLSKSKQQSENENPWSTKNGIYQKTLSNEKLEYTQQTQQQPIGGGGGGGGAGIIGTSPPLTNPIGSSPFGSLPTPSQQQIPPPVTRSSSTPQIFFGVQDPGVFFRNPLSHPKFLEGLLHSAVSQNDQQHNPNQFQQTQYQHQPIGGGAGGKKSDEFLEDENSRLSKSLPPTSRYSLSSNIMRSSSSRGSQEFDDEEIESNEMLTLDPNDIISSLFAGEGLRQSSNITPPLPIIGGGNNSFGNTTQQSSSPSSSSKIKPLFNTSLHINQMVHQHEFVADLLNDDILEEERNSIKKKYIHNQTPLGGSSSNINQVPNFVGVPSSPQQHHHQFGVSTPNGSMNRNNTSSFPSMSSSNGVLLGSGSNKSIPTNTTPVNQFEWIPTNVKSNNTIVVAEWNNILDVDITSRNKKIKSFQEHDSNSSNHLMNELDNDDVDNVHDNDVNSSNIESNKNIKKSPSEQQQQQESRQNEVGNSTTLSSSGSGGGSKVMSYTDAVQARKKNK